MPLPDYEKKSYKVTRTTHGSWYLSSYRYKFNLKNIKTMFKGLSEGKILGVRCRSCNMVSFPPRLICGRCMVMPDDWVTLPETASVATGSASYRDDPDGGEPIPTPVIAVQQDGSQTCWVQNLPDDFPFHDVYIGMPLKVHWADELTGSWTDISWYDPIEDPADEINKELKAKRK